MTQTIEQLTARVRELEEEIARLKCRHSDAWEQLAASQLHAEQLREVLDVVSIAPLVNDCGLPKYGVSVSEMKLVQKAISLPRDTSALDAYVSEKVKEARPDFRQMREMLRAMQAGELTVSRGIEILDMWHAGNWNDNMLPPVRQDLIEEDSMPVEIIDRCNQQISTLTRQRDLAVEALEKQGHSAGCRKNAFGDICTCGLDDLLSTIKESEAMAQGEKK